MGEVDWPALRGAVVLFVLAVVAGTIAAAGGIRFNDEAMRGHEREKGRLESIRSRYRTIDEQRRLIDAWLPRFRGLQADGVIGEERRLAWIERLRSVAGRVRLPSLRYRIERRTAHETGLEPGTGAYLPFSTVVRIEAGLLHEGDLERLFRELAVPGAGLHRVERCEIRRAGPEFVTAPDAINLLAECDLRWITLAQAETNE